MDPFILTILDTTGIQDYVFGSNSLKHIIGASHLVHAATHEWVYEAISDCCHNNNLVEENHSYTLNDSQMIENGNLDAELVYTGGGNSVILFRSESQAKTFARSLTKHLLVAAPGLDVVICHLPVDWERDQLSKKIEEATVLLQQKKAYRSQSVPQLGLGVTGECQYTGLPAVQIDHDDNNRWISEEARCKRNAAKDADARLTRILDSDEYIFQNNFNDLGDKGVSSYLAVVHIDGNGMGKRIKKLGEKQLGNRQYIQTMRDFSRSIEKAADEGLLAMIDSLINPIDEDRKIKGKVQVEEEKGMMKIPFRPLVYGGDDLTFVCDGRLALTLTADYLDFLLKKNLSDGLPFSCRAGVAVVKSHFPFIRAYKIAEDLAKNAKKRIAELEKDSNTMPACMDWHFASSGPILPLEEIREREYKTQAGLLLMRPIQVGGNNNWQNFTVFSGIVSEFQNEYWNEHKNKLMDLRELLRKGPDAVSNYIKLFRLRDLPAIPDSDDPCKTGWFGQRCTCFDAIEAMDFFVPLK